MQDQTDIDPLSQEHLVACHDCDALFSAPHLEDGEEIVCPRCGRRMLFNRRNSQQKASAFAISAILFLILTHSFTFMTFEIGGRLNEVHLIGTVKAFFANERPILGLAVLLFIVIAPMVMAMGMLYLLFPALFKIKPPGGQKICRAIYSLIPWNMLEVFLVGILVSIMKLGELATLELKFGFWAMICLMVCLTMSFVSIDKHEIWEEVSP